MSESYTKVERKIRKPKSKKYEILRMKNNSVSEEKKYITKRSFYNFFITRKLFTERIKHASIFAKLIK